MSSDSKGRLRWQSLGLHKRDNNADEYEDACSAAPRVGRFAIADGASESSYASLWAQLLVEGFTHAAMSQVPGVSWLASLRQRWAAAVDCRTLPWYAEAKRQEGAFATLLGIIFRRSAGDKTTGRWRAVAVGDSCLFQVRQDCLLEAFPLGRSQEFGNQPDLLCSRSATGRPPRQKQIQGRWQIGDRFYLATDALAEWFLRQHETGSKPWQELEALLTEATAQAAFAGWVEDQRARQVLRNDDVTLLRIAVRS